MTRSASVRDVRTPPAAERPAGAVHVGEVLTLAELARRFGWQRHAVRQAKRLGLPVIRLGRQNFVRGVDFAGWLAELQRRNTTEPEMVP